MNNKSLGYLIAIIGLIILATTMIKEVHDFFQITLKLPISQINSTTLTIISVIIIAVGIYFVVKSGPASSKKVKEVPIFHGKNIVGYRRH